MTNLFAETFFFLSKTPLRYDILIITAFVLYHPFCVSASVFRNNVNE